MRGFRRSVAGIWQALTVSSFTLALFWTLLNTLILGLFVATAFRESRNNRREAAGQPPLGAKRAAKQAAAHPEPTTTGNRLAERSYDNLTPVGAR